MYYLSLEILKEMSLAASRRSRCVEEEDGGGLTSNQSSLTSGRLTGNERFDSNRDHIIADYERRQCKYKQEWK
jgi:hypothetical protein